MSIIFEGNEAMVYNQAFIQSLEGKGQEKAATALTDFIRVKIREASFGRRIIIPKNVTSTDLDRSLTTDQPYRIVEMDKVSTAYPVTYFESAQQKYYTGSKFPVYYTTFKSEEFFKPIEEIMTYRVPIKTIIQENYLKDIQAAEDKRFIAACNTIIATRNTATPGDATYATAGPFTPAILAEGLKLLIKKQVPVGCILISELDFADLWKLNQATVGSAVMEDIMVNGYTYTKLLGQNFIRTNKFDIVPQGTIYLFSTPEFLGVFDILTDVKAFVEQKANHLRFYLYETVGMAFGNVNGVASIVLS